MGFMCPGFDSRRESAVVPSVTRDQELPSCRTEPVPDGSEVALLLLLLPDLSLMAEYYSRVRLPPNFCTRQQNATIWCLLSN